MQTRNRGDYTIAGHELVAEGADLRVQVLTLAAGQCVPWHYHTEISDSFVCLEGPMVVETRAPRHIYRLLPGERCAVPPKTAHLRARRGRRRVQVSHRARRRRVRLRCGRRVSQIISRDFSDPASASGWIFRHARPRVPDPSDPPRLWPSSRSRDHPREIEPAEWRMISVLVEGRVIGPAGAGDLCPRV